jgi:G2-specific checkpoint protein
MKLALKANDVKNFRKILGFILLIRKQCIFKFDKELLSIYSLDKELPMACASIGRINFLRFDVIAKDDLIGFEINVEPLFQILRNYEKSPSTSDLVIKLQRGEDEPVTGNGNGNQATNTNKKRAVFLALSYNEDITIRTEIFHSFSIPVNLLRRNILDSISTPPLRNVEIVMDLNRMLNPFFGRIERYRNTESLNLVVNRLGEMKVELEDGEKKISIKWKNLLDNCRPEDVDTQAQNQTDDKDPNDLDMIKEIAVKVRSRWWNIVSRLLEFGETLQMYIYANGCAFTCNPDDEQSCTLIYYLPGKLLEFD